MKKDKQFFSRVTRSCNSIVPFFYLAAFLCTCISVKADPQIWFAPLDDHTRTLNVRLGIIPEKDGSSTDYMSLFDVGSPWAKTASKVAVFKMYNQLYDISDNDLQKILTFLARNNIALALEFGPLTPAGCGNGIEGFGGTAAAQFIVDKIKKNGGNLQYIAMDEPFYFGHIYKGLNACQWTPQQVATNAAQSLSILSAAFPGLKIGDIEPTIGAMLPVDWVDQYAQWLDAFQMATGKPLAFFHADSPPASTVRIGDINRIRTETIKRNIPFGVLYTGQGYETSDSDWVGSSSDFFMTYETSNSNIPPDHAVFQSWMAYPRHVLPETTPNTFTWLVNRYARTRTTLTSCLDGNSVAGTLSDTLGNPIGKASVALTASPASGQGLVDTFVVRGVAPSTVKQGIVQLGLNLYGFQGLVDINLYSYKYSESARSVVLDFSSGLSGWGGTTPVTLTSDANGASVQMKSTSNLAGFYNTKSFPITPGSPFTLEVKARISPASVSSGYVAVLFIGDTGVETSRITYPFSLPNLPLGSTLTNANGAYIVPFPLADIANFKVDAGYSGTDGNWPTSTTLTPSLGSCLPQLSLAPGWNLVGNSSGASLNVESVFGDPNKVISVWKWKVTGDTAGITYPTWAYYSPSLVGGGSAYASSKGYDLISSIEKGEGFWVNSTSAFSVPLSAQSRAQASDFQQTKNRALAAGWNLIAVGDNKTAVGFNEAVGGDIKSLWAWDSAKSNWYFYAPSLDGVGSNALNDYITSNGYLDFVPTKRTIGPGVGLWVNRP